MAKIAETAIAMLMLSLAWCAGLGLAFGVIAFVSNGFQPIGNERMNAVFAYAVPAAIFCAAMNMVLLVERREE